MTRPKRIDLPYALYHVFSRTNSGDIAFRDWKDEQKYLSYVEKYRNIFSFRVHAWCLMPTHFHLLLENCDRPALSEFMHRLLTAYTIYFNRRHKRHGHLFQGRFKSFLVDKTSYLLALSRYIHCNPVSSGKSKDPTEYRASSLKYYVKGSEPEFLYTKETLEYFNGNRKDYEKFIREGLNKETKPPILQQCFVGDDEFAHRIRKMLSYVNKKGTKAQRAHLISERKLQEEEKIKAENLINAVARYFGLSTSLIVKGVKVRGDIGKARMIAMVLLREFLPWTCLQISRYLGIKGKKGMGYYMEKFKKNSDGQKIMKEIKKTLKYRK